MSEMDERLRRVANATSVEIQTGLTMRSRLARRPFASDAPRTPVLAFFAPRALAFSSSQHEPTEIRFGHEVSDGIVDVLHVDDHLERPLAARPVATP